MPSAAQDPVFFAYAAASVVLVVNVLVLWNMSGAVRSRTKTTTNPEDAAAFKANLVEADPPEVARVLRVHRNTAENTYPFLLLGLVFIHLGPSALEAQILFGTFAAARVLYSFCYLKGIQPWRSIFYSVGLLALTAMLIDVCRLLLK